MHKNIGIFLGYYLPAILWAGIIFYFSSIPGLQMNTGNITLEIIARKFAHLIEFAVLYWLFFRIFFHAHGVGLKNSLQISFVLIIIFAFSDEYHQTFTSGRSGRFIDVVFDSISAFLGMQIIAGTINKKFNFSRLIYIFVSIAVLAIMEFGMIKEGEKIEEERVVENINTTQDLGPSPAISEPVADGNTAKSQLPGNDALPQKILIKMPFTTQAPFANWDEYHEEACEEASLIMIKYYLDGKKLTPETSEKEIQKMIAFQIEKYGDYKDTNARESVKLFDEFYPKPADGTRLRVIYDFNQEDLKRYLSRGRPIVIPAAGRMLGNPNFTAPGPLYHNLVLVGYDGDTIITNDPGTRKGEGYRYDINVLYKAIHDFPGEKEDILKGRKAMIVLE